MAIEIETVLNTIACTSMLLMPVIYLLAYWRKGRWLYRIPLGIRYLYYFALCISSLYAGYVSVISMWERHSDVATALRIFITIVAGLACASIIYQIICRKYTWLQRLLKKDTINIERN